MQRQPVRQGDAPAGTDLHGGRPGAAVEGGEAHRERKGRSAARSVGTRASAGSPARESGSRGPSTASPSAPARSPRGRRGSRDRRSARRCPCRGCRRSPSTPASPRADERTRGRRGAAAARVEPRGGERRPELRRLGVFRRLVAAPGRGERRPGSGGADRGEPVAQLLRRDAVDAVVVLDLGEDRARHAPRASARRRPPSRRRSSPRPGARCR